MKKKPCMFFCQKMLLQDVGVCPLPLNAHNYSYITCNININGPKCPFPFLFFSTTRETCHPTVEYNSAHLCTVIRKPHQENEMTLDSYPPPQPQPQPQPPWFVAKKFKVWIYLMSFRSSLSVITQSLSNQSSSRSV